MVTPSWITSHGEVQNQVRPTNPEESTRPLLEKVSRSF